MCTALLCAFHIPLKHSCEQNLVAGSFNSMHVGQLCLASLPQPAAHREAAAGTTAVAAAGTAAAVPTAGVSLLAAVVVCSAALMLRRGSCSSCA